ncbi:MAG: hypothetical protein H7061_14375 [Bdellovibrionaceae bacterium]|nr:hypothetical protein [Bdellovibrio sp.]
MIVLIVFQLIGFVRANTIPDSVKECRLEYEALPCDRSATIETKALRDLNKFSKDVAYASKDKKKLSCQLDIKTETDLKDFVQIEISRLAPQIQKLQKLRNENSRTASEVSEIDRIEIILKRSSLLSYSSELESIADQIKQEKIWNPNRLSKEIEKKSIKVSKSLKLNGFPEVLFKEMSYNQKNIENCDLAGSANNSARSYHFFKILLQNFSANSVVEAAKKCPYQKSTGEVCTATKVDRIKILESEISEQVCFLKELSPNIGAQIEKVSLEIPSVAGELVTNGNGPRPSEEEAKSKDFRLNVLCAEDLSLGGLARGAIGAGASFATHELSHEVVSRAVGKKLEWNTSSGTWQCNNCNDQIKPIAIAGLVSHNISSEVIVRNQDNDSQLQKGWLLFNIYSTSSYFIRDWLARSGKIGGSGYATGTVDKNGAGDLRAFSKKESYILGSLMIGHQLYSGYRYLNNRQDYQCKKNW